MRPGGDHVDKKSPEAFDKHANHGNDVNKAIFSLGDQLIYAQARQNGLKHGSPDTLSFLSGEHDMLRRIPIGNEKRPAGEVPEFLERLTAVQAPANHELVRRLQSLGNHTLLSDVHNKADQFALAEVGQASEAGPSKHTAASELPILPPGGADRRRKQV